MQQLSVLVSSPDVYFQKKHSNYFPEMCVRERKRTDTGIRVGGSIKQLLRGYAATFPDHLQSEK